MEKQKVVEILNSLDIDPAKKQELIGRLDSEGYSEDVKDEIARLLDAEEDKTLQEIDRINEEKAAELEDIELTEEEKKDLKEIEEDYKDELAGAAAGYREQMGKLNDELERDAKEIEDDQKKN